jgi:methionine aminotransferase
VIEPAFDSYLPAIQLAGGKAIPIAMEIVRDGDGLVDSYALPWEALANAITPKTRLILTNTPHNPTASIWSAADLERLYSLVKDTSILILSDEVYEHMVFDGKPHESIARHAALAERSFVVSSFGKTFHVTGWKLAFIAAPAALMHEYRKVHQFNVFSVNTPMQYGIAHYLQNPEHYLGLPAFYQAKRDYFRAGLASTPLKLLPCAGSYFQCVDYTALPRKEASLSEAEFCRWLTTELGVAAIPNSAFYANQTESGVIRFCFAKQESTLKTALHRLQALAS